MSVSERRFPALVNAPGFAFTEAMPTFTEKRKHILAARFGNPVKDGCYYEQSVIFPGTMWVFMRQYTNIDPAEILSGGDAVLPIDRWNSKDRIEYIKCMQESIFKLLNPQKKDEDHAEEQV